MIVGQAVVVVDVAVVMRVARGRMLWRVSSGLSVRWMDVVFL